MNTIKILSPDLVSKIAAGEVVERPASVVKELVENALDAGATRISVEIRKGGIDEIRVSDDGSGMSADDAMLSVQRHATSKIGSFEDLFQLHTFGFRGEALASIPEVSLFRLETRAKGAEAGFFLEKDASGWHEGRCSMSFGTIISVRNLFYNVPARQKFLKTPFTEYSHIAATLLDFALVLPQVSMKLTHNEQEVFHYTALGQWMSRIEETLRFSRRSDSLLPIEWEAQGMKLQGYISSPPGAASGKKQQYIYVNERPVRDAIILRAIQDAYQGHIPRDRFPACVLKLYIPPHLVDVNVHPRKAEVKFADTKSVYEFVRGAVSCALTGASYQTACFTPSQGTNLRAVAQEEQSSEAELISSPLVVGSAETRISAPLSHTTIVSRGQTPIPKRSITIQQAREGIALYQKLFAAGDTHHEKAAAAGNVWTLLGQVAKRYIVCSRADTIAIFDQHAAAEGVLYEKMKKQIQDGKVRSQSLFLPLLMDLPAHLFDGILESQALFRDLGFVLEPMGGKSIVIREVPTDMTSTDLKSLILGIAADILDETEFRKIQNLSEKRDQVLKYAACRSAVKFNDPLAQGEQEALLKSVADWNVTHCAHGRPIVWEIPFRELDKKFVRC